MSKINFSITQNGKPLAPALYSWDEKTRTLITKENCLVLDFSDVDDCTLHLGNFCNVTVGNNCNIIAGYDCVFIAGSGCTFNTERHCDFRTSDSCRFKTKLYCNFITGSHCTFDTPDRCTFNTMGGCTFKTGGYCVFRTENNCTFDTGSNCTFSTGDYCTFKTAHNCAFDTHWCCTFRTSHDCTFDTAAKCTFDVTYNCVFKINHSSVVKIIDTSFRNKCVVSRRDTREFYEVTHKEIAIAPGYIEGYVADGYYYRDGKKQYKAIIADGILSEVIEHKGNVYKVINHGEDEITYLVQDGDLYAHGDTLKEAKENLIYKISNRDASVYKDYTLDTVLSFEEAIKMYRVITGACERGTRYFVDTVLKDDRKEEYTVKEIVELTRGQYGHEKLEEFFKIS